jgi:SAM-dependent methyltransferase
MTTIDFGRHSDDYAEHRPGFPASFYRRLDGMVGIAGSRALDLATGPGTVALGLAALGGTVTGIDVAAAQVETAARVARERQLHDRTRFLVARAEDTGLEDDAFDLAIAGQAWHWFDGVATLREMQRVLRPGGALVIAFYSYLAEHSPVARDTEALILELNPRWTMAGWTGMFPELVDELIRGGFELIEQFCYDHARVFTHTGWRGRMRTCNGVGSGGLSPDRVQRFDRKLERLLDERYPEPLTVPHRVWCVVGRRPA